MNRIKKRYQQLFARYHVRLRQANSKVYHCLRPRATEVTPLQFALFETAVKAIDAHYQALIRMRYVPNMGSSTPDSADEWVASYESTRELHGNIARRNGFTLENSQVSPEVAHANYLYCCRELGDLYYDLLD